MSGASEGGASLRGRRILLTRAAGDLAALAERVRARGAEPVLFPCIEFAPPVDLGALERAIDRLAQDPPAALALASPHAVGELLARLEARGLSPARALSGIFIGASGEATLRALEAAGISAQAPLAGAGAEPLAKLLVDRLCPSSPPGESRARAPARVLVPQAADATPALASRLRDACLEVETIALYQTLPLGALTSAHEEGLAALRARDLDAIAFASGSAARGFAKLLGDEAAALAAHVRIACMGESCAAVARGLGFPVAAVGQGGFDSLLDALGACYPPFLEPSRHRPTSL